MTFCNNCFVRISAVAELCPLTMFHSCALSLRISFSLSSRSCCKRRLSRSRSSTRRVISVGTTWFAILLFSCMPFNLSMHPCKASEGQSASKRMLRSKPNPRRTGCCALALFLIVSSSFSTYRRVAFACLVDPRLLLVASCLLQRFWPRRRQIVSSSAI